MSFHIILVLGLDASLLWEILKDMALLRGSALSFAERELLFRHICLSGLPLRRESWIGSRGLEENICAGASGAKVQSQ